MPRLLTVYLNVESSICRHKTRAALTLQLPLSAEAVMQQLGLYQQALEIVQLPH